MKKLGYKINLLVVALVLISSGAQAMGSGSKRPPVTDMEVNIKQWNNS